MATTETKKSAVDENQNHPNKYLQPFLYQQWKIIGQILQPQDNKNLGSHQRPLREFIYRFTRNIGGMFGLFMLILLIMGAIIIPFTTGDPKMISPSNRFIIPFTGDHILGTDALGRDLWATLWAGLRFSLLLSAFVTMIDLIIGVATGLLMGYSERFDYVMQFLIKIITNIPVIMIMILATLVFKPSFWSLAISMSIVGWTGMANQIRAQVKRGKNYMWVTASRVLGTPSWKIIVNFLPLLAPMIITQLVFTIPLSILSETGLAFIGLSIPNEPTLGNLIFDGKDLITIYPRYTLIPAAVLVILVTSVQLIGNSTQEALRRQR